MQEALAREERCLADPAQVQAEAAASLDAGLQRDIEGLRCEAEARQYRPYCPKEVHR